MCKPGADIFFFFLMLMYKLQSTKTLVHGWWYAYAVQRMATPPFNKVLATNGVVKQQVQIKTY